jgi:hypothetical protein
MMAKIATAAELGFWKVGHRLFPERHALHIFHSDHYLRHNARRLEHLASLRIPVTGQKVLEVGAGIGDHSNYYIDRGCPITITEARPDSVKYLQKRFPAHDVQLLDLEAAKPPANGPFDIVHCYGLLYHLGNPDQALDFLGAHCQKTLLLETCVSFGDELDTHLISERQIDPSQAYSGTGCRPTRPWIFKKLGSLFEFVYCPETQPNLEEFPLDWTSPKQHLAPLSRAVFIASRTPIENPLLSAKLVPVQRRHE